MTASEPWLHWHDRLHRQLLLKPTLLPRGTTLLLALSGGQDSMALLGLLRDLRKHHHWTLQLWHGDHGWHPGSACVSKDLAKWCAQEALPLRVSRSTAEITSGEAAARAWRYSELSQYAQQLNQTCASSNSCTVVTAHTASDRAETLLMQLSRGTDLAGLGSLRQSRPLQANASNGPRLVRPLLDFTREETAAICQDLQLPVWHDPSNSDLRIERNRIRLELLPVLESLHAGCSRRMALLSERISQVHDTQNALVDLSLQSINSPGNGLQRPPLQALAPDPRRTLLQRWLQQRGVRSLQARQLEELSRAIGPQQPPGERHLSSGHRLHWCRNWVQLNNRD